jgi:hypothetical protein
MLEHQGIYLSRADLLGDPFEGSVTANNQTKWAELARRHGISADAASGLSKYRTAMRKEVYINCWHLSDVESAAM